MPNIIPAKEAIVVINTALYKVLHESLNNREYTDDDNIDIRFDLPERDSQPSNPTISVFLYDVHEDLQLRTSDVKQYNSSTGVLLPGWANINCNYLITYWEPNKSGSDGRNPDSLPNNQAAVVMSLVVSTLFNNRQLADLPGAYTRVMPPQENLNSLGNFWQSLDNRPHLSLMYSISVPIYIGKEITIPPIKEQIAELDKK